MIVKEYIINFMSLNGYLSLRFPNIEKSEYSRALNASCTFQPLMSFCLDLIKFRYPLCDAPL